MEAAPFPPWLLDHGRRLMSRDADLQNLNLNIRRVNPRMMCFLAESLRDNDVLVVLNLTSSLYHDPSALNPLAEIVLPHHQSLTVLHLGYNRISNVTALGQALVTNKQLQEVCLDYNRIDSSGAKALAQGLRSNSTLKILRLNYNIIGDEGCTALAGALATNSSLVELSIKHNSITNASSIQEALLKWNYNIKKIDLDLNELPVRQVACIQIICRANEAGRRFLLANDEYADVWPAFLARVNQDPDVLYFFLQSKPDLLCALQSKTRHDLDI